MRFAMYAPPTLKTRWAIWLVSSLAAYAVVRFLVFDILTAIDLFPPNAFQGRFLFHERQKIVFLILEFGLPYIDAFLVFVLMTWLGYTSISRYLDNRAGWTTLRRAHPGFRRRIVSTGKIGLVVIAAPAVFLAVWAQWNSFCGGTPAAFDRTCTQCHSHLTALSRNKAPDDWRQTVERMREKNSSEMSEKDSDDSARYLLAVRSRFPDREFAFKCGACHATSVDGAARTKDEWTRLARVLSDRQPFFMPTTSIDAVLEHLEALGAIAPAGPADETASLFENACSRCHNLDIVLRTNITNESWEAVLIRMWTKAPQLASREDVVDLVPFVLQMRQDPSEFRRRFPHQSAALFFGGSP